jgi:hypothetical protein
MLGTDPIARLGLAFAFEIDLDLFMVAGMSRGLVDVSSDVEEVEYDGVLGTGISSSGCEVSVGETDMIHYNQSTVK